MTTTTLPETGRNEGLHGLQSPPIVTREEWETAREQLFVQEKALN